MASLPRHCSLRTSTGALSLTGRLQDIFGKENLFVEIQDHGIAAQKTTNPSLIKIAQALGAPLLATNDSHYCRREDTVAHDALLCVQTGATIHDPKRFKFEGQEHYLKSASEMRHLLEGKMNELLICEMRTSLPFTSTGSNGLPVPTSARPLVQRNRSAGLASDFEVGFESGNMMGRSTWLAISRTISSVNAPVCAETPSRIVTLALRTT